MIDNDKHKVSYQFKKNSPRIKNYASATCLKGHRHDSVGEAAYCNQLQLLLKAGEIIDIEYQKTFDLCIDGKKICGHRVDFLVTMPDGSKCVHEYKGFATQLWALKKKMFEACYPEIEYKVKGRKDLI
jgi:hypothetical protein